MNKQSKVIDTDNIMWLPGSQGGRREKGVKFMVTEED